MKTSMNLKRIAQMGIASSAIFFLTSVMPVKAEGSNSRLFNYPETEAAAFRLDILNLEIEASLRFVAPSVSMTDEMNAAEAEAAGFRLEDMNNSIQDMIRFEAPAVDVKAESFEYEVNQAVESLENLNQAIEKSIRFQAPEVSEDKEAN